jgi:uncharacterized protein (TIGR02118 family)
MTGGGRVDPVSGPVAVTDKRTERNPMSKAKLVVLYPQPTDQVQFERDYAEEHVPLMQAKMKGMTALVTKLVATPAGPPQFFYMAEIYGPSIEAIQEFLGTPDGKEVAANAFKISSGGPPTVIFSEENTYNL